MPQPKVKAFFDEATFTVTYVVSDPDTGNCVVIDPVLDFDMASGRISHASVNAVVDYIKAENLSLDLVLETHVHADHLSAASVLKSQLQARTAIGTHITGVQEVFTDIFNLDDVATDGSQFDLLFADGDEFSIGNIRGQVLHTPGHTPACLTYLIGNAAFVGDTLFMPDYGSARCDFPGGDAAVLYDSIQRILSLPDETIIYLCHDYKAPGRDEFAWQSTVAEQRQKNVHINDSVSKEEFVEFRTTRDSKLGMPKLILPSIQLNIRAGDTPAPETNGLSYLKIPLNAL